MRRKSILFFTILFLLLPDSAHAQTASIERENSATVGFSIYPPISKVRVYKPGQVKLKYSLKNESSRQKDLKLEFVPFEAVKDNSGKALPSSSSNPRYEEIFKSVKILDGNNQVPLISLLPKERKDINISIDITDSHLNGDYYFTLVFLNSGQESNDSSYSRLDTAISSNVLLSIALGGNISSNFSISRFDTKWLYFAGPVPFVAEIANKGQNFDTVRGTLEIRNMFGQKTAEIKLYPQNILSNSLRLLNNPPQDSKGMSIKERNLYQNNLVWNEGFLFGIYKATLKIENVGTQPSFKSLYFIGIPLVFLLILILILTILIGIYLRVKKKRSKIKHKPTSEKK